jgi:hypothetical protein
VLRLSNEVRELRAAKSLRSHGNKFMKTIILVASLAVATTIILPCQGQTSAPATKRTVWVEPPTGSLLGRGAIDAGDQGDGRSSAATVSAAEKPTFRTALSELNAHSATVVEGLSLIGPSVSGQTGVPLDTLKKQRAATGLSFGELLVANSLASGSGKNFNEIVRMKAKAQTWSHLAQQLNINIDSISARLRTASESVKYAESRRDQRREQNIRDTMGQIKNNGRMKPGG